MLHCLGSKKGSVKVYIKFGQTYNTQEEQVDYTAIYEAKSLLNSIKN